MELNPDDVFMLYKQIFMSEGIIDQPMWKVVEGTKYPSCGKLFYGAVYLDDI